jgi:ribosomal protein S18 acetylase RimI-like enzyme
MDGDAVRGLARYGRGGPDAKPDHWYTVEPGDGAIACLWTEPGDLEAALPLVDAALADLADLECGRIWAFEDELGPRFYNGGFGSLSVTMGEVGRALTMRGFGVHASEFHMLRERLADLRRAEEAACKVVFDVRTTRTESGEWCVDATMDSGSPVGQCVWAPMSSHSNNPDARRFGYVWWLGIDGQFQGMGAGRRLLLIAMSQMRDNGHEAVVLTTGADNKPAQSLYMSEGFHVTDVSMILGRPLSNGRRAEQHERDSR